MYTPAFDEDQYCTWNQHDYSYPIIIKKINYNLLLTKSVGCTAEYWPKVVAVRTELSEARTKMTKGQYSPVWLEQARLVRSLLYDNSFCCKIEFAGFRNNDPIKKEQITMLGLTSRLLCHIIKHNIIINDHFIIDVAKKSYYLTNFNSLCHGLKFAFDSCGQWNPTTKKMTPLNQDVKGDKDFIRNIEQA